MERPGEVGVGDRAAMPSFHKKFGDELRAASDEPVDAAVPQAKKMRSPASSSLSSLCSYKDKVCV